MLNIQPKTYNDAVRLSRCFEVRKYVPKLTDDIIENMYYFISANPLNKIGLSNGIVYYVDAAGQKTEAFTVEMIEGVDQIILSASVFKVVNTVTDSGCGGCGCSSNNNNNNNNNNNG